MFTELNYQEALNLIKIRNGILRRKIELFDDQIIKNQAYTKLSKSILEKLKAQENS